MENHKSFSIHFRNMHYFVIIVYILKKYPKHLQLKFARFYKVKGVKILWQVTVNDWAATAQYRSGYPFPKQQKFVMNNLALQMLRIIKVFLQHVLLCNTHTSKPSKAMSMLPGMAPHIRSGKVINISPTRFTLAPRKHSQKTKLQESVTHQESRTAAELQREMITQHLSSFLFKHNVKSAVFQWPSGQHYIPHPCNILSLNLVWDLWHARTSTANGNCTSKIIHCKRLFWWRFHHIFLSMSCSISCFKLSFQPRAMCLCSL